MNLECKILKACEQDLYELATLEAECFTKPWSEASLKADLLKTNAYYIKAVLDDKIIGYVGMYISFDEADITRICVSPDYRHQGIARSLLNAIIDYCKQNGISLLHLDVKATNTPAINLYKAFNFTQDCIRKRYYADRTDAILMTKEFRH